MIVLVYRWHWYCKTQFWWLMKVQLLVFFGNDLGPDGLSPDVLSP